MKITDTRKSLVMCIEDMQLGQVFMHNNVPFMRTPKCSDEEFPGVTYNAVNLKCGTYTHFNEGDMYECVDAELRIKYLGE